MGSRKKKRPLNITISEGARAGGEALADLEGCSISELIEMLMRDAMKKHGIERAYTEAQIRSAVERVSKS